MEVKVRGRVSLGCVVCGGVDGRMNALPAARLDRLEGVVDREMKSTTPRAAQSRHTITTLHTTHLVPLVIHLDAVTTAAAQVRVVAHGLENRACIACIDAMRGLVQSSYTDTTRWDLCTQHRDPRTHARTRPGVPRVAGHVVGEHEHDAGIGDPQAPEELVEREGVGHVAVVEPEARCAGLFIGGGGGWAMPGSVGRVHPFGWSCGRWPLLTRTAQVSPSPCA